MINEDKRQEKLKAKEKVRKRVQLNMDDIAYEYYPQKKAVDYHDNDIHQRVAIYVRVSTDDVRQTTSFELQQKYYEEFVTQHPNWTLVKIYADEGISGTSLAHRDSFNEMIADCKAGKIDLIITKSVSRFARNVVLCIGIVRSLQELKHPVGVYFESEGIFSLNEDSQMALSFQATMAEEESHTRSRSMESSLRMRLDHNLPLTPKLLGYQHDSDGNLVVNPEEAPTVKLAFFMYLYGYSTQQIADAFTEMQRKTYLGNVTWTAGSIIQILRNERHCGDVLTRKTYTPNYRDHLSKKNRGQRPQTRYFGRHEAIISRDDFNAVQRMLDNAKYGNRSILPELRVVDQGLLKGFVVIHPRWAGFTEKDYFQASNSVYLSDETCSHEKNISPMKVECGDFDLRGFEIARAEFFDTNSHNQITFSHNKIKLNTACVRKINGQYVELLINPVEQKIAIRSAESSAKTALQISKMNKGNYMPREVSATAFYKTICALLGWNIDYKYRITGQVCETEKEIAIIFDVSNAEMFLDAKTLSENDGLQPLEVSGHRIKAVPEAWISSFGQQFYKHEHDMTSLKSQCESEWKIRLDGRLFDTGDRFEITPFSEIKEYITREFDTHAIDWEAVANG